MDFHATYETTIELDYEIERDKPMPSLNHSIVQSRLAFLLQRDYDREFTIPSEVELEFLPKNAVPDLCIYPKMRVNFREDDTVKMSVPPLTAIEILSPRQALEDILSKARKQYFPNGVRSVWVVLTSLETVVVLVPDAIPQFFPSGEIHDPATGVRLQVGEVFQS